MTGFFCADASQARDEPMFATASQVERWLLVEQSGPFSGESVPASRIDAQALAWLSALVRRERARLVLIRRPPRVPGEDGIRVYYADVRPGQEHLVTTVVADQEALRHLTLGDASDPDWTPVRDPIYLVCTHGKHDTCCAVRGRPLVAAFAEVLPPERIWECSHVGGDRFAGNVVALPWGLYLGRVEPEAAASVVEHVDAGRIPLPFTRGRSCLTAAVQAAQHFARTDGGYGALDAVDDLLPHRTEPAPDDGPAAWTILLAASDHDVSVTVRRVSSGAPAQLTCHSADEKHYPVFELVRLETAGAPV